MSAQVLQQQCAGNKSFSSGEQIQQKVGITGIREKSLKIHLNEHFGCLFATDLAMMGFWGQTRQNS